MTPHLLVERHGPILVATMNRPEVRNAWSLEMLARMADVWDEIDADPEVRVAILTGAGGTFCSGSDLKVMHGDHSADPWHARFSADPELAWKAMLRARTLAKPLVAAVEGHALAGGTEILQAADIRVAGDSATFGLPECRHGLFPLGGSTVRLPRQVPYTRAMEILLTGDSLTADEALSIGLIGRVVPDGTALEVALGIARRIAANGPLAVQAIKRSVREGLAMSEADALKNELALGWPVFQSADAKEGARAFKEKRAPQFTGS